MRTERKKILWTLKIFQQTQNSIQVLNFTISLVRSIQCGWRLTFFKTHNFNLIFRYCCFVRRVPHEFRAVIYPRLGIESEEMTWGNRRRTRKKKKNVETITTMSRRIPIQFNWNISLSLLNFFESLYHRMRDWWISTIRLNAHAADSLVRAPKKNISIASWKSS